MALIDVRNLSFFFGNDNVLEDINFSILQGTVLALLGPNGSGKTTLLKLLMGFLVPAQGEILLDGCSLQTIGRKDLARRIAYVPQFHRAAFSYRVLDVVLMGRTPHKGFFSPFSQADSTLADQALDKVGIWHLRERPYTEISGGERQLVLIARALCQGARTFILDEPANGLDYGNQIRLLEQLAALASDGYTFVMSTHFPDHVLWVASQALMLRNGRVIGQGLPTEILTQDNLCRLYNADIEVRQLQDDFQVCIPQRMRRRKGECLPRSSE